MRANLVLAPKKQPVQQRAMVTYRAIVVATARVLERRGYEAITTNQVARAAGVGIASVYEYFPGKPALVAAVITDTVDTVIRELHSGLERALASGGGDAVEQWIELMFAAIEKRRRLVAVLVEEVPFFWQVPAVQEARTRLHDLSRLARSLNPDAPAAHIEAVVYLLPIMVSNAVIDAVLRPPKGLDAVEIRKALTHAVRRLVY